MQGGQEKRPHLRPPWQEARGSPWQPVAKVPAAFERRCIPPDCVAPRSNMPNILPRPALSGTGVLCPRAPSARWRPRRSRCNAGCIRLPGAGLIFSSGNGRKWTEPPGKLLHDEVVPAQICRHRGVGLCGCEGVGNEGHEGRLAGRRTCAEHVAVESAHGRLAVPLSPRQLVGASSAATVGPGGSLAGRWVWRLPRRIPVPHGGARPRGSRRWRRRDEDTRRGPTPRTAASCLVAFPPLAAKPTGRGLGRRRDGAD